MALLYLNLRLIIDGSLRAKRRVNCYNEVVL